MAGGRRHPLLAQAGARFGALALALAFVLSPALAFAQNYGDGNYGGNKYGVYDAPSTSGGGGGSPGSISIPISGSGAMNPLPGAPSTTGTSTAPSSTSSAPPANGGATGASSSSNVTLSRTLTLGDKGSDVQALQEYLKSVGYLSIDATTDFFGSLTSAAVQKYQCDKGIICSGTPDTTGWGSVGPLTLAALAGASVAAGGNAGTGATAPDASGSTSSSSTPSSGSSFSLARVLYRGLNGTDVSAAQSILARVGYLAADSVTGYFGTLTWNAVMKFQCDKDIVCSGDEVLTGWGTIGPKTAAILNSL